MRSVAAALGRVLVAVLAVVALTGPSAATLWVSTPSVDDIQSRVEAITKSYGVPLLGENEVPQTLSEAVIATEDERFYEHHGIDSLGLARALLYDIVNVCLC